MLEMYRKFKAERTIAESQGKQDVEEKKGR